MKTLLIPTTFQNDSIDAVKAAISYANGNPCTLLLMLVTDVQETFSASSLLRNLDNKWTNAQENVLESCRALIETNPNCKLKVHNQFGVTSPLIRNLLDYYTIELVIIPSSFKTSSLKIHQYCTQILANYKCPILHINQAAEEIHFNNAMYLENEKSNYPLANVQHFVQQQFSLKIVSQAKISSTESSEQLIPLVTEAICKNEVDIIIETRKPEKIKISKTKSQSIDEALGLPVLSIYEEAYL
jgi:hypothetical protein